MRIGIISEGHSDRAVIASLILRASSLEWSDIKALRPVYKFDATDLAISDDKSKSNWTHIKNECESKELISAFLSIEGQDFVAVHIDTAEAELYEVDRPAKGDKSYCSELRQKVISKIQTWLGCEYVNNVLYAVAIEETEAWLLSIYTDMKDTTVSAKPKEKLSFELGRKGINSTVNESNFADLSKPFRKMKEKEFQGILKTNCSLLEFFNEVSEKLSV